MVGMKLVCARWNEIIESNAALWQTLDLPKGSVKWNNEIIDKFQEKNKGNFKVISIGVKVEKEDFQELADKLKTMQSLRSLSVQVSERCDLKEVLSEFHHGFPALVELRLLDDDGTAVNSRVRVKIPNLTLKGREDKGSPLQLLWIHHHHDSLNINLPLTANLASLSVDYWHGSAKWSSLLQISAKSLRHLRLTVHEMFPMVKVEDGEPKLVEPLPLSFTQLMVLEIRVACSETFPSWMIIPSHTKLLLEGTDTFEGLPNVRELWVDNFLGWKGLKQSCPSLDTLRIDNQSQDQTSRSRLVKLLRTRDKKINSGFKVQGTRMIPLETLVIPLDQFSESELEVIKKLVNKVVDLKDAPELLEL